MKHVVVDPITRIEGHLRVELQVDEASGKVTDAISSGTAWRGLELVMNDRDPRDAWAYIQRICGVCTSSHALGCLRAVEDAFGITIPKNAHYIRNIIAACLGHQDHIIHFYHLHALDWVSPLEALKADPAATAALQSTVLQTYRLPFRGPAAFDTDAYPHDFPIASPDYYAAIKAKVQKIVDSGQLGIFSAQWWDHPDYQLLPPEVHLMAISHYLEMLDKQKDLVVPHVVFGGKNPHPHYVLGGMPCSISMEDGNAPINAARLAIVDRSINQARHMMNDYYLPDVLAIGHLYVQKGYTSGGGLAKKRVLAFGMFPEEPFSGASNGDFFKNLLVRCNGVVEDFASGVMNAKVYDFTEKDLTEADGVAESVEHGWYEYKGGDDKALHPWEGETTPHYTEPKEGTKTERKALNEQGKYSWLKTRPSGTLHSYLHEGEAGAPRRADVGREDDRRSDRRRDEAAERPCRGMAALHGRPHGGACTRCTAAGRGQQVFLRQARREHQEWRYEGRQHGEVGALDLAEGSKGRRSLRGTARRAQSLGGHQGRQDRELSGGCSDDLERLPA